MFFTSRELKPKSRGIVSSNRPFFLTFQSADIPDQDQSGRIWFLQRPRGIAVRRTRRRSQDRPPQVQLLHVRVRSRARPAGQVAGVRPAHFAHLPARLWRPPHRGERHRYGLGQTKRGRFVTYRSARGESLLCGKFRRLRYFICEMIKRWGARKRFLYKSFAYTIENLCVIYFYSFWSMYCRCHLVELLEDYVWLQYIVLLRVKRAPFCAEHKRFRLWY